MKGAAARWDNRKLDMTESGGQQHNEDYKLRLCSLHNASYKKGINNWSLQPLNFLHNARSLPIYPEGHFVAQLHTHMCKHTYTLSYYSWDFSIKCIYLSSAAV